MATVNQDLLAEQLELADALRMGRGTMLEPQNLPGRYGRVIEAVDRVLTATGTTAVLAGGWAVWRHGYIGRVTQDVDIVVAAADLKEFLQVASVSGFDILTPPTGRWPKLLHRDTGIEVDVLPEGERPGTPSHPAPTTIPHPSTFTSEQGRLVYIELGPLILLKLAAGRARDDSDVVELIRVNRSCVDGIRQLLADAHPVYCERFDALARRADDESE